MDIKFYLKQRFFNNFLYIKKIEKNTLLELTVVAFMIMDVFMLCKKYNDNFEKSKNTYKNNMCS